MLYPLYFEPSFHYRIWGGNKLKNFGKNIKEENIGESWEISTVPNFVSVVSNGELEGKNLNEIIAEYKEKLLGKYVFQKFGEDFPLLIKFIDAAAPLSVQVHPNDQYAREHHNSFGKTEMWYIISAEKDSDIIIGFNKNLSKEEYIKHVEDNTLEKILRKVHPETGDVFFIPAGRVHAIGKGITLAEIQQTSDITYRIYDYNRIDKDGKARELHTKQAAEVADFSFIESPQAVYDKEGNYSNLVTSPYFVTNRYVLNFSTALKSNPDSFRILICTEGSFRIQYSDLNFNVNKGQSVLIPACLPNIELLPNQKNTTLLEVHIKE